MLNRSAIGALVSVAALAFAAVSAQAQDASKYPDWSGQWKRPPGAGIQWDQTKPPGRAQNPPLTPEYRAIFEASLADQAKGGQGENARVSCTTNGVPRVMTVIRPIEFIIQPKVTYIIFESYMPRRLYTDGRSFPTDQEPAMIGYSIGNWRTRTATAATTCSRSRRAASKGRAISRRPACRSTATTRPW